MCATSEVDGRPSNPFGPLGVDGSRLRDTHRNPSPRDVGDPSSPLDPSVTDVGELSTGEVWTFYLRNFSSFRFDTGG